MTVSVWRKQAAVRLMHSGDADAVYDSKLLLAAALNVEPSEITFMAQDELNDVTLAKLNDMLTRREGGEPEQYIEGKAYFMGLAFNVDKRVLIPRQDTETLCEAALEVLKGMSAPKVLDMCTGSGALAVSIKKLCPKAAVTAVDISPDALTVARENALLNSADVEFIESDGFNAMDGRIFDLIVCNPPYLTKSDMDELQTEVRREPALALFGGEDGLDLYRRFATEMRTHLTDGGYALFEVGMGQADAVAELMGDAETINDLCGVKRVVKVLNTGNIHG